MEGDVISFFGQNLADQRTSLFITETDEFRVAGGGDELKRQMMRCGVVLLMKRSGRCEVAFMEPYSQKYSWTQICKHNPAPKTYPTSPYHHHRGHRATRIPYQKSKWNHSRRVLFCAKPPPLPENPPPCRRLDVSDRLSISNTSNSTYHSRRRLY